VNPNELGVTLLLAAVLLGLAGYFGRQQLRMLRGLASPHVLGADDRRFLRAQAYRRLLCSALMVIFAGMLIGWVFLEKEMRGTPPVEPGAVPTEEQKEVLRVSLSYWIAAVLVLMVLLALAATDFWATARFGLSQHRKLQADHRAMLEEQANRRRQERNGQHRS
jgi:hypothetical protein